MFLGISILQLLKYVMAVTKRFYNHLRNRIASIEPERQIEQQDDKDSETDVVNCTDYHQEINLDLERMWKICSNLPEEIKLIKLEMSELKTKMESNETDTSQRKEVLLIDRNQSKYSVTSKPSKIPIRIPKPDP